MIFNALRKTVTATPRLPLVLNKTIKRASHGHARDGVYRPKSTKEIWAGDAGAYPVMFGIGWCLFFATAFSVYYFFISPDVRVFGKSKEKLFRGDMPEYTRDSHV